MTGYPLVVFRGAGQPGKEILQQAAILRGMGFVVRHMPRGLEILEKIIFT